MSLSLKAVSIQVDTTIDLDDLDAGPDHQVQVHVEPAIPESVALALALGAAKSLVNALQDKMGQPHTFLNVGEEGEGIR